LHIFIEFVLLYFRKCTFSGVPDYTRSSPKVKFTWHGRVCHLKDLTIVGNSCDRILSALSRKTTCDDGRAETMKTAYATL